VDEGHPEHVAETARIAPSVARVMPSGGSELPRKKDEPLSMLPAKSESVLKPVDNSPLQETVILCECLLGSILV
jgi:hypothetical protein